MPYGLSQAMMVDAARIARGPNLAPGRLVVAVSSGTPLTTRSTPLRSRVYLRRMNETAPA